MDRKATSAAKDVPLISYLAERIIIHLFGGSGIQVLMAFQGFVLTVRGYPHSDGKKIQEMIESNGGKVIHFGRDLTHVVVPKTAKARTKELLNPMLEGSGRTPVSFVDKDWVTKTISEHNEKMKQMRIQQNAAKMRKKQRSGAGSGGIACVVRVVPPILRKVDAGLEGLCIAVFGTNFKDSDDMQVYVEDLKLEGESLEWHSASSLLVKISKDVVEKLKPGAALVKASNDCGSSIGSGTLLTIDSDPFSDMDNDTSALMRLKLQRLTESISLMQSDLMSLRTGHPGAGIGIPFDMQPMQQMQQPMQQIQQQMQQMQQPFLQVPQMQVSQIDAVARGPLKGEDRHMKIFISSTFIDMQEERNTLVRKLIPRIRILCMERNVQVSFFDMRWGITDVQLEQGNSLGMCLKQVAECNFFLGILGERYGWCLSQTHRTKPTKRDKLLKTTIDMATEDFPFISMYSDRSVSEIETRFALRRVDDLKNGNSGSAADRIESFFFVRDEYFVESVDSKERSKYSSEGPFQKEKLDILKADLRERAERNEENPISVHDYKHVEEFQRETLKILRKHVDETYPESDLAEMSPLESESFSHNVYSSKLRRVFIPNQETFLLLDKHVAGVANVPLILTGDASGCGKSATIANWAYQYSQHHPEDLVIEHYVGCSSRSSDHTQMLWRILSEIQVHTGNFSMRIPESEEELAESFYNNLEQLVSTSSKHRILLLIDGIEHLGERNSAHDLVWLPITFPKNARVVITCSKEENQMFSVLQRRGYPTLEILPLSKGERVAFIRRWLRLSSKRLNDDLESKIAESDQTGNARYLSVLLDDIETGSVNLDLSRSISKDLRTKSTYEMYDTVILSRLEQDNGGDGKFRNVAGLIWAARRGLYLQKELYYILNQERGIEPDEAEETFISLSEFLLTSGGLVRFQNSDIIKAVERRYVRTKSLKRGFHSLIAKYFMSEKDLTDRKVEELPYQLMSARMTNDLIVCVSDMSMFLRLYTPQNKFDLLKYWRYISAEKSTDALNDFSIASIYDASLADPSRFPYDALRPDVFFAVASFMEDMALFTDARRIFEQARELYENGSQRIRVADTDCRIADLLVKMAEFEEAEKLLESAVDIYAREKGECKELSDAKESLGILYRQVNRLQESEKRLLEALDIRSKLYGEEDVNVAFLHKHLMDLYAVMGRKDKAKESGELALKIVERDFGFEHTKVADVLLSLGHVHMLRSEFVDAKAMFDRALNIFVNKYGEDHPDTADAIYEIGCYYILKPEEILGGESAREDDTPWASDLAEDWLKRALRIKELTLGKSHPEVSRVLLRLGALVMEETNFIMAEEYLYRSLNIRKEKLGKEHSRVAHTLKHIITLHEMQEQYEKAIEAGMQSLEIFHKLYGDDVLAKISNIQQRLGFAYLHLFETLGKRKYVTINSEKIDSPTLKVRALEYLNSSLAGFIEFYGEDHVIVREARKIIEEVKNPPKKVVVEKVVVKKEIGPPPPPPPPPLFGKAPPGPLGPPGPPPIPPPRPPPVPPPEMPVFANSRYSLLEEIRSFGKEPEVIQEMEKDYGEEQEQMEIPMDEPEQLPMQMPQMPMPMGSQVQMPMPLFENMQQLRSEVAQMPAEQLPMPMSKPPPMGKPPPRPQMAPQPPQKLRKAKASKRRAEPQTWWKQNYMFQM